MDKNFSVTGKVNYISELYLITLCDDVRISANVNFVTHDVVMNVIRQCKIYRQIVLEESL